MAKTYEGALEALQKIPQDYKATIAGHIERIEDSKVVIIDKLTKWESLTGTEGGWQIDDAALALDKIDTFELGEVELTQAEKEFGPGYYKRFTIKAGDITGVYKLQEKIITPTKARQVITADPDYDALSTVTVEPIPAAYQNVTGVTATADQVLAGAVFVDSTGEPVDGIMANNGDFAAVLDTVTTNITIPQGYHSGNSTVDVALEEKVVDFAPAGQTVTPSAGKVLSKVTVNAAPTTTVSIDAEPVKQNDGYYKVSATTGTGYINNGSASVTLNPITELTVSGTKVSVNKGYTDSEISVDLAVADSDLTAVNIKSGVELFGIAGTFTNSDTVEGEGQTAATAGDMLSGTSAWVDGKQINGSIVRRDAIDATLTPTSDSYNISNGYYAVDGNIDVASSNLTPDFNPAGATYTASDSFYKEVVIPAVPDTEILPTEVLTGKKYYNHGELKEGTMANHGDITVDADEAILESQSTGVELVNLTAGYVNSVNVTFDGSLYARLAAI